jgi:hypothetical protein
MRHIKIPGLLVALLVATSFCTYAQDQKAAIQQKLESQYALTKPTADRTDIVTAGAILVLNKDNLMMVDATSSGNPYQNTYKDGKITHNALGKFAGFANRLPGGAAAGQPGATRTFVAGEKMWVTKIDVRDNAVIFELFTDAFGNTRYKASLTFPFKGAVPPPDDAVKMVSEVFKVQPADDAGGQQPAPAAAGAADQPPAAITPPPPATDAPPPPIQAPPPVPADTPPQTISLGQTKDQVVAAMGQPVRIADLGKKQIYYYKDLKITFVDGKVTDVQ